MNINMKYYIVTICAIFIALGVGMLVGFNLNYDQALSRQQSEVLESFNTEFDNLKDKNKALQAEIDKMDGDITKIEEYLQENIDILTQDVLTGKNTGIILTSENNDYSEEIEEIISKANGTTSFNIVIKDSINNKDKISEISDNLNESFKSSQDVINYIINALSTSKGYEQLYALENLGVLKINSINEELYQSYDSVVLLGELSGKDANTKFNAKEKLIIDGLKEKNKYMVAATQSESNNTILKLYSDNNISTIDNINEVIGKISLTTLLKNQNIVGHFGNSDVSKELIAFE